MLLWCFWFCFWIFSGEILKKNEWYKILQEISVEIGQKALYVTNQSFFGLVFTTSRLMTIHMKEICVECLCQSFFGKKGEYSGGDLSLAWL